MLSFCSSSVVIRWSNTVNLVLIFKNLAEKKRKSSEDISKMEAEMKDLQANYEVKYWTKINLVVRFCCNCWISTLLYSGADIFFKSSVMLWLRERINKLIQRRLVQFLQSVFKNLDSHSGCSLFARLR
jgi:hypothetical protein